MSDIPQFEKVIPTVLDARRVSIRIKTLNLPKTTVAACGIRVDASAPSPAVQLNLESTPPQPPAPAETPDDADFENSKFPVVEINLVDENRQPVAHSMIIEHSDPDVDITLHIREPQPGSVYTAYAEMIYHQKLVHVVEAPFILQPDEVEV